MHIIATFNDLFSKFYYPLNYVDLPYDNHDEKNLCDDGILSSQLGTSNVQYLDYS
jgi:hypothetical protein